MKTRNLIIALLLFFATTASAQRYQFLYEALSDEEPCQALIIEGSDEVIKEVIKNQTQLKAVKSVRLMGYKNYDGWEELFLFLTTLDSLETLEFYYNDGLTNVPASVSELKIGTIKIMGAPTIDYSQLMKNLANISTLKSLTLVDNNLSVIPSDIAGLKSLKSLEIKGNSELNYRDVIDALKDNDELESLSIPMNNITEIPENIGELNNLKELNITDNYISDLPKEMGKLENLETLSTEGNIFIQADSTFTKLSGINLKYLSLDSSITQKEVEYLKLLFPNCEIINPHELTPMVASVIPQSPFHKKKTFKQELCSDAYIHYPTYFYSNDNVFDSTLFFDRMIDTSYANTVFINDVTFIEGLTIELKKSKKTIEFRINSSNSNYPELSAFEGMYWVYKGELSKKKVSKYISKNKLWFDVRINFNSSDKTFSFYLKNQNGSITFKAFPMMIGGNQNLSKVQKLYTNRYRKYSNILNLRAKRYNHELKKKKIQFENLHDQIELNKWMEFQNHMCAWEKELERSEWNNYYEWLLNNEKNILDGTAANLVYFSRYFEMEGYNNLKKAPSGKDIININYNFVDSLNRKVYAKRVYLFDKEGKSFIEVNKKLEMNPYNRNVLLIYSKDKHWYIIGEDETDKQAFFEKKVTTIPFRFKAKKLPSQATFKNIYNEF